MANDYDLAMQAVRGLEFLSRRLYRNGVADTLVLSRQDLLAADVDVAQSIRDAIALLLKQRAAHRTELDKEAGK